MSFAENCIRYDKSINPYTQTNAEKMEEQRNKFFLDIVADGLHLKSAEELAQEREDADPDGIFMPRFSALELIGEKK